MERSELALSAILIVAVAGGAFWNAHRIHASGFRPVIISGDAFPNAGKGAALESSSGSSGDAYPAPVPATRNLLGKRDVNRATAAELAEVRGIGVVLSNEIVSYREQHGPFRTMEDLLRVSGIGPSRLGAVCELFEVVSQDGFPGQSISGVRSEVSLSGEGSLGNSVANTGWPRAAEVPDPRFDVNTATVSELMTVPGIGPVLAGNIIRFREQNGPFQSIQDLILVSGIGEKRLEAFSAHLRVGGSGGGSASPALTTVTNRMQPAVSSLGAADGSGSERPPYPGERSRISAGGKIDLNRATKEELMSLPGIGSVLAERIIIERRIGGPFQSPADIQRVSGIGEKKFEAIRDQVETRY